MKLSRRLLLALLVLAARSVAAGAIDFTPVTGERTLNGIKFPFLTFTHDGKKITYEQPRGWDYKAAGSSIRFTPPNVPYAQAEIEQSTLAKPQGFNEETIKTLQTAVVNSLPGGSQKASVTSTEKNPLKINRSATLEVTVSYEISGIEYARSVTFVNFGETQVRFRVTARRTEFEKVRKAFRGSLFSWQPH